MASFDFQLVLSSSQHFLVLQTRFVISLSLVLALFSGFFFSVYLSFCT